MSSKETISEIEKPPLGNNSDRPPRPAAIKTHERSQSMASRDGLRKDMHKLRRSLTNTEHLFLDTLCDEGGDVEVEIARQRLNDTSLFFQPEDDEEEKEEKRDDNAFGNGITIGGDVHVSDEGAIKSPFSSRSTISKGYGSMSSFGSRSSFKGQQYLHERRNSAVHGRMWKAHEQGIAVSNTGSRKSVMRRSISASARLDREQMIRCNSLLSTATQDLLLQGGPKGRDGEDEIFRKSDNSSAEQRSRTSDMISPSLPRSIMRPPDIPSPSMGFARISSDSSRKSVTFREVLQRRESEIRNSMSPRLSRTIMSRGISEESSGSDSRMFGSNSTLESFPPIKPGEAVRSDSILSAPSLHKGQPVRSESNVSIPIISRAHSVRSESNTSIPPIGRAHAVRSESNMSIPIIGRAHAVRSESNISALSNDDLDKPAWASPLASPVTEGKLLRNPNAEPIAKPMLLRKASCNVYQGEGIEVSEIDTEVENVNKARLYTSMLSMGEGSVLSTGSWDEGSDRKNIFRDIRSSLSDDELANFFLGNAKGVLHGSTSSIPDLNDGNGPSWDMNSDTEEHRSDAWNVLKDEYAIGYGANGTLPFRILGTSADDADATPHVLSPPLMESLQQFFPFAMSDDNFWMKYSLIRDGASFHSLLQQIRGAKYTILAVETADGEVFGSFTSEPWRKNWNYFGTGESFLWRMRKSRKTVCHSVIDQAQMESELDVYPWTGENNCVQLCTHDKIAIGGGTASSETKDETEPAYGFGLSIDRDLLRATSSHCATFGSPPLSKSHPNGEPFEIVNMEVWTLTPCAALEEAEKLELGMLFLQNHRQ